MRVGTMGRSVSVRSRKPLVVRGGLARTFGSLASFLAVSFLFCGLYLLADAFAHPLDAGPVSEHLRRRALHHSGDHLVFYLPRHAKRTRSSQLKRAG